MLRAHRQAWAWQDEWYGLTIEDIRKIERDTAEALKLKMSEYLIFDLCKITYCVSLCLVWNFGHREYKEIRPGATGEASPVRPHNETPTPPYR